MRSINETFDDMEFKELQKRKGKMSWHDAILLWAGIKKNTEEKNETTADNRRA